MSVLLAYMYMYHMYSSYLWRPERALISLMKIRDTCELATMWVLGA